MHINTPHTGDAAARNSGVIPSQWITAVFSGSVPPAQAAQILDYAVLTNCQFAGACCLWCVYFVAVWI